MSRFLEFKQVAREVNVSHNRLTYIMRRDGITPAKISEEDGRTRLFSRGQLREIKQSVSKTRAYRKHRALLSLWG